MKNESKETRIIVKTLAAFFIILIFALTIKHWNWLNIYGDNEISPANIISGISTLCVGTIGVFLLAARAKASDETAKVATASLITEQYKIGVELLSSQKEASKVAGMAMLIRLSSDDHNIMQMDAMDTIIAYSANQKVNEKQDIFTEITNARENYTFNINTEDRVAIAATNRIFHEYKEMKRISRCRFVSQDEFKNRSIKNATFIKCIFYKIEFNECNFADIIFDECIFIECNFNYCKFIRTLFYENYFVNENIKSTSSFFKCSFRKTGMNAHTHKYHNRVDFRLSDVTGLAANAMHLDFEECWYHEFPIGITDNTCIGKLAKDLVLAETRNGIEIYGDHLNTPPAL